MGKLIGYTDRQIADLLAAAVRRDDLYIDHWVRGARASRPAFGLALDALYEGDTLVITTLDRLGRSTAKMLELATVLR
jgi:DNA invertase Pin-like site-specific DNA recombinase